MNLQIPFENLEKMSPRNHRKITKTKLGEKKNMVYDMIMMVACGINPENFQLPMKRSVGK